MATTKSIFFSANRAFALSHSRTDLLKKFVDSGYSVSVLVPNDLCVNLLLDIGCRHLPLPIARQPFSLLQDFSTLKSALLYLFKYRPSILYLFHIKPIFFFCLASLLVPNYNPIIVTNITGLGHAFVHKSIFQFVSLLLFKFSFKISSLILFQNADDRQLFLPLSRTITRRTRVIGGVGIDIEKFSYVSRKSSRTSTFNILMVGRLIGPKGVLEFLSVAKHFYEVGAPMKFTWVGESDPSHPDHISPSIFDNYSNVNYLNFTADMVSIYHQSDILLFTSHREGSPRAVMEACSTGLPVLGFNVPGVKSLIVDNRSGFICNLHDIDTLIAKINYLFQDSVFRHSMGYNARLHAESHFRRSSSLSKTLSQISSVLPSPL